jgi:2-amino-4-hydroxy-6-hydroxymethyldihydropteridine diphosphokinase
MNTVYLGLGGNMGNRLLMLHSALRYIENKIGSIVSFSSVYETAAWGNKGQAAFLNQAVKVSTDLKVEKVLKIILSIEEKMGRMRGNLRWQERIIDIDILFFNDNIIRKEKISVPHPEIPNRKFVLVPMVEIDAEFVHPVLKKTMRELLNSCPDELEVVPYIDPHFNGKSSFEQP